MLDSSQRVLTMLKKIILLSLKGSGDFSIGGRWSSAGVLNLWFLTPLGDISTLLHIRCLHNDS